VRLIAFRRAASTTRLYLAEDFADIRECGQLTELAERVAADPAQESTAKVDATGLLRNRNQDDLALLCQ
jgi:hypothetical protein